MTYVKSVRASMYLSGTGKSENRFGELGKGRRLTAPPHTTTHAGPHVAVRRSHRAVTGY
jgi:hypothetical protein